ncbi:MAG: hypothetical protein JWN04_6457 [Myxococcaceae bacterium]|nr:hypothetical protein [Myxococcaceae bacterium]
MANLDAVSVSGLHGTLSQEEIRGALEPRLPKFLRCAAARLSELEVLSGSLTLSFHVAVNGSVASVSPNQSSLGDRATERCMLEVAQTTHFPAPHGGEADFTWPLELPLASDVRAPAALPAGFAQPVTTARVRGVEQADAVHGACGGGEYVVTTYVDPDGHVLAAGVATPDPVTTPELDCVAEAVASWTFPSPGSYPGKLSFTVP